MARPLRASGAQERTLEYLVAKSVSWKYRGWCHRNGMESHELKRELLPHLFKASLAYRDGTGASRKAFLWRCALRRVGQIMDPLERTRTSRNKWPHLRHVTSYRPAADLEQDEVIKLALAGIANPRDRTALSMHCGGLTDREIGRRLGISGQRASQIIERAVREARHALMREAVRVGSTLDECWR